MRQLNVIMTTKIGENNASMIAAPCQSTKIQHTINAALICYHSNLKFSIKLMFKTSDLIVNLLIFKLR